MPSLFVQLMDFFGLSGSSPATLGELVPWLLQVFFAVFIIAMAFRCVQTVVISITRGRWF